MKPEDMFKIISCFCGKFIIIDLPDADSNAGVEKYGKFRTKELAQQRMIELFCSYTIEKEVLNDLER